MLAVDVCLVLAVKSHGAVSLTVFGAAPLVAEVGHSPVEVRYLLLLSGESLLPVLLYDVLQLPISAISHMLIKNYKLRNSTHFSTCSQMFTEVHSVYMQQMYSKSELLWLIVYTKEWMPK